MTQDTYRGQISDPASLNRYGFVENNPINLTDRYGFSHEEHKASYLPLLIKGAIDTDEYETGYQQREQEHLQQDLESFHEGPESFQQSYQTFKQNLSSAYGFLQQQAADIDKRISIAKGKCEPKPDERAQRACYLAKLGFVPMEEEATEIADTKPEGIKPHLEAPLKCAPGCIPMRPKPEALVVLATVATAGQSFNDQCASKLSEIMQVAQKIASRRQDLLIDQHNLFENYYLESNPHPQHGSYQGHQRQMRERQRNLEKLKKEYNDMGCPKPPKGLPNAEQVLVPLSPSRANQVAPSISPEKVIIGGAATVGVGYLLYRGIRLLPSILFPPSFVPNLIIP